MRKLTLQTLLASFLLAGTAHAITTTVNPADPFYSTPRGGPYDGLARLFFQFGPDWFGCSGALLGTGQHVLTAGHCVADAFGAPLPNTGLAQFFTASGNYQIPVSDYIVFPGWDGDVFSGTDLAIIQLATPAPADANRYDLYTGSAETGKVVDLAGYGTYGTGVTGAVGPFGPRLHGYNIYDTGGAGVGISPNILLGDFDNGYTLNDALGYFGFPQTGLGMYEAMTSFGDSGGPTFLNGKIAGVHSFVATIGCPADVLTPANQFGPAGCKLDASFGEIFGDSRVSAFSGFIAASVPEPGSFVLAGAGLIGLLVLRRKR